MSALGWSLTALGVLIFAFVFAAVFFFRFASVARRTRTETGA